MGASRWRDALTLMENLRTPECLGDPRLYYNLGVAYRAVGQDQRAIASLEHFQQMPRSQLPEGLRVAAESQAQQALLELRAHLARVRWRVVPSDARVRIDGEPVANVAGGVPVDPGVHVLTFDAPEYRSVDRRVEVSAGASLEVVAQLELQDSRARVRVNVLPALATVEIDGRPVGQGTVDEAVRPGTVRLAARAPGYQAFARSLQLEAGDRTRVRVQLLPLEAPVWRNPWLWVGTLGGAAIVGGVVLGVVLSQPRPVRGDFGNFGPVGY